MRKLLTILFLLPLFVSAQTSKSCPTGYRWLSSFSWDYNTWELDDCYPDSTAKRIELNIAKDLCKIQDGWGSSFISLDEDGKVGSSGYSEFSKNIWVNDSIGCKSTQVYKKLVKDKWLEISECQYYYENKTHCESYNGKESKTIPCCGHIHLKPETNWK